jgi:hypothetical protein
MNLTKAAAVIALIVALVAAGYLAYDATLVRSRYDAAVLACTNCTTLKESMAANWREVQSNIELLKAKRKNREAEKFARDHAGEKPLDIDIPCTDCETPAPDYTMPSAITGLGLIASTLLFGASKPRRK